MRNKELRPLLVCALASMMSSSAGATQQGIESQPLQPRGSSATMRFEMLSPEESGIDLINPLDPENPMSFLYYSGMSCGGVAIGDVDGDNKPDIYLTHGPGKNRLYRQAGDMTFEDVTDDSGTAGSGAWGTGVAMVDIDDDGDLDIFACNYAAPNLLYVNSGTGHFTEEASAWGIDTIDASLMPAFCDYDLDGDLDFYLLTNRWHDPNGFPEKSPVRVDRLGRPYIIPEMVKYYHLWRQGGEWNMQPVGRPDRLFRNNGDGTFTDVSDQAGIAGRGDGLAATWWDYNDDGYPDIYVGNDFAEPDLLYHNNGDGTFRNVLNEVVPHTTWFSMGADVGDINNDGRLDFLISEMASTTHFMEKTTMGAMGSLFHLVKDSKPQQYMRNALYLNTETQRFMEIAYLTGLAESDWTWSVKLADFDNDGRVDVFFSNGAARNSTDSDLTGRGGSPNRSDVVGKHIWHFYRDLPARREHNLAFQNSGDFLFESVGAAWGLDHYGMSYGTATGDLDRDGDLDLVMVNLDEPVTVYRNQSPEGNRVLIALHGKRSNRYGLGARVRLKTDAEIQVRQLMPQTGFLSSNEPVVHFGLGPAEEIRELTVEWPSGITQRFEDLPVNRFFSVTEPASADPATPKAEDPKRTLFRASTALSAVRHREHPYDDFKRQPLLPNKLSQLGPGVSWGDVDGDGVAELYVGGAAGESGVLYRRAGNGSYVFSTWYPFFEDRASEDMAAIFFDADGDGDLDLFVVSGGVECEAGDPSLKDRLYLNEKMGIFVRAPIDAIPDYRDSGSAAAAADFDHDGDLDLFVGGRSIPGRYPLTPKSHLLRNEGGRFLDVTDAAAPGLEETGLVTGALWSDCDNDGWVDLLVTHEWGPVKVFINGGGRLTERTTESGLSQWLGWWNGIAGGDVDNDGDIDYVVTNFGLNTKYRASVEKPALLYYGDYAGRGEMHLMEAEFENDVLYPIRGKSCTTSAIPAMANRFSTYRDFALASLVEVYTTEVLEAAYRFEANTLESAILLNDGSGNFSLRALPRLAQASPAFGAVLADLDGDRNLDVYLVQNLFTPQQETGRFDGGLSLLLTGRGDGTFKPLWPVDSGLSVPEDAKGLAITDINGDSRPDLSIGINDGTMLAFENLGAPGGHWLRVELNGRPGNPTAVGARLAARYKDGLTRTVEIYAGSGYLSQSEPVGYFAYREGDELERIEIRWPDGKIHTVIPEKGANRMAVSQGAL